MTAVVYTSYSLRTGEAIKETELAVDECVEDGESMAMPTVPCLMFLKSFSYLCHTSDLFASDPRSHYLRELVICLAHSKVSSN